MFIDTLEHISSLELDGYSYEFSLIGVFRDPRNGMFLYGFDSGCSCPTPWENTSESDLHPLNAVTWDEFTGKIMDSRGHNIPAAERAGWIVRLIPLITEAKTRAVTPFTNPFVDPR